ncbi:hypothetical protein C8R43DRAFT_948269 [Mycena crocata]|nr:hypothetical protein C8R43DRAFT_948269 [Mycena crocata]
MPADFFQLTNRFLCNPRRNEAGCNKSLQWTDPHIIAQLPRFVQTAFPACISARGAVSKLMMWQMSNTFSARLVPSPFAELVSEIQHRSHAENELAYVAVANFYRQQGVKQYSAFDDPQGYAVSPPSVPYLKALFTDYTTAQHIYIEHDIASLLATVLKGNHTFDVLKHMGGVKDEKIINAAYTVLNEDEEVRGHSLATRESMDFVEDMFEGIQQGLKDSNHPPIQFFYTDSPQSELFITIAGYLSIKHIPVERSFHESINQSQARNVQPVTDWADLPCFERTVDIPTVLVSDSLLIEEGASDILADVLNSICASQLYLVAIGIKTEQLPGKPLCVDVIQLRTKQGIYCFEVTALASRSDFLPSLRSILTNQSIIKIGHSIRQTLQTIADMFMLPEIGHMLKAQNAPILDLGKYVKLKGALDDPSAWIQEIAGSTKGYPPEDAETPGYRYPWSSTPSSEQINFLFLEINCQLQIFISLCQCDFTGLPLLPGQAMTDGQLVTLVQGCKPVAEGSIVGQHVGYLNAVMDAAGKTNKLNISLTRSLIVISKTLKWIFNHGARAVVNTSQLHPRGAIAPVMINTVARTFSVPAPPSSFDDGVEFSPTTDQTSPPLVFEHWSESMAEGSGDHSDSNSEFESEEDPHTQLVFGLLNPNAMQHDDIMDGIEADWGSGGNQSSDPLLQGVSTQMLMDGWMDEFNFVTLGVIKEWREVERAQLARRARCMVERCAEVFPSRAAEDVVRPRLEASAAGIACRRGNETRLEAIGVEEPDVLMENLVDTVAILQNSETLPTRIFDDTFHFMDRLLRLLSKKHSAFKAFAHDFSEAIFIRDKSDEAAVRAVLEKHGVDWQYTKRAKAKALNQRIRRYIPQRQILLKRLETLFDAYTDM